MKNSDKRIPARFLFPAWPRIDLESKTEYGIRNRSNTADKFLRLGRTFEKRVYPLRVTSILFSISNVHSVREDQRSHLRELVIREISELPWKRFVLRPSIKPEVATLYHVICFQCKSFYRLDINFSSWCWREECDGAVRARLETRLNIITYWRV